MSEKDFNDLTVKELLELGISYEKEIQKIYDTLMKSDLPSTQKKGSKRLKGQEKDQENSLKHIYRNMFSESEPKSSNTKKKDYKDPEERDTSENVERAMELEKKSQKCYETIAEKLEEGSDHKNIKYIAFMEKSHYKMLETKFPH